MPPGQKIIQKRSQTYSQKSMSTAYKEKATGWRTQITPFVSSHLIFKKKKRGKIEVHLLAFKAKDFRLH